jgi:hypothetical protein
VEGVEEEDEDGEGNEEDGGVERVFLVGVGGEEEEEEWGEGGHTTLVEETADEVVGAPVVG